MNLYFDEDLGKGIAEALRGVGVRGSTHARRVFRDRFDRGETIPDEDWLTYCGRGNYLGISCNVGILAAEAQREVLIDEKVGVLFVTSGRESSFDVLRMLLRRWEWLEAVYRNEPRPFAYLVSLRGTPRLDTRVSA